MKGLPLLVVLYGVGTVASQLLAVAFLPLTKGFTDVIPSLACAACMVIGAFGLARMSQTGADLSTIIPLIAAVIPLGSIAIGVVIFGEPASLLRLLILIFACGLVGAASIVG